MADDVRDRDTATATVFSAIATRTAFAADATRQFIARITEAVWLLATGFWNDSGTWDDSANWID